MARMLANPELFDNSPKLLNLTGIQLPENLVKWELLALCWKALVTGMQGVDQVSNSVIICHILSLLFVRELVAKRKSTIKLGCFKDGKMDIYTQFNRQRIDDRHIDTLIGLAKGITADGKVDQNEAEVLLNWLAQSRDISEHPIILNLFDKVCSFLEDDVLDVDESSELLSILLRISGDPSEFGEIAKTSSLPVNDPVPSIIFPDKLFLFTGTCVYGTRKQCQKAIEELGGINAPSVSKKLDYLVLGTYVTDSWIHESFGRKIEKAMKYRDDGIPVAIVTEKNWLLSGGIEC